MKIINIKKWLCLLLVFSMVLQSCSVYKNKSITLDEAIASKNKVKVTKADGTTDAFDRIEKRDSTYYGLLKNNEEYTSRPINKNDYVKIQPKNKTASTLLTVGVIVVPIFAIVGLLQIVDVGNAHL